MNAFPLAFAYIRHRPLAAALNVILLGLGTAAIALLLMASEQFDERLRKDADVVDMVVGSKGSPMQLVLSSVFHVDVPVGNIRLADIHFLDGHPMVKNLTPLALGDGFRGYRIVGTTHAYAGKYGSTLAEGRLWEEPLEATLGAAVASRTGLRTGDWFSGEHGVGGGGHVHESHPYRVVGILTPTGTVLDRLVLCSVETVRIVHELADEGEEQHDKHDKHAQGNTDLFAGGDDEEITAVLVDFSTPIAASSLPREINKDTSVQAARPALEIGRLLRLAGFGAEILGVFALILVLAAAGGVFAALFHALEERRSDLAMMRVLGATRLRLFWQILLEGLILSMAGVGAGLVLAHSATWVAGRWLWETTQVVVSASWASGEAWLVAGVLALGLAAALPSAVRAFRLDIPRTLSGG